VALSRRPPSGRRPGRAPLAVVAVANALWATITSLAPVLLTVGLVTLVGTSRPSPVMTLRYGAAAWLLAHGVPLTLGGFPFALVPLAITVLALWRLFVAGRNAAKASRSHPAVLGSAVGLAYGLIGLAAATYADGSGLSLSAWGAFATLTVVGAVTAFFGASVGGRRLRRWTRHMPPLLREGVRVGVAATFFMLAAGAVAAGVAIALGGGTATAMLRNYHAGVGGQAGIIMICLVYAPNVTVWAAAYLAGPGFTLAGVPQLPVFAGLPNHSVNGAAQVLLATPVLAGAIAGIVMVRRPGGVGLSGWGLTGAAALGGPIAGVVLAGVGWAAAGSLGSKLLSRTGDVGWQFPIVCAIGIACGAALGAFVAAPKSEA
jgi:hypothetical protein